MRRFATVAIACLCLVAGAVASPPTSMQAVSVQGAAPQSQAAAPAGTASGGCQSQSAATDEDDCPAPAKSAQVAPDKDVATALKHINAAITANPQPNDLSCALVGIQPVAQDLFGSNYWTPTSQSLDLTVGGDTWKAVQDAISKSVTSTTAPSSALFIPEIALQATIPKGQPGEGKYVILMSFEYQTWQFYSNGILRGGTLVLNPDKYYKKLKHLLPPGSSS